MLCVGLVIGVESNLLSNNIIDQYKSRYSLAAAPTQSPPRLVTVRGRIVFTVNINTLRGMSSFLTWFVKFEQPVLDWCTMLYLKVDYFNIN